VEAALAYWGKKENPFTISNLFDSRINSNLRMVPTRKIKSSFGPRQKKEENPFTISNLFDSRTNSNLRMVPTCKLKYKSTHQYKRKYAAA
jgi:hypothetical protein